MSLLKSRWLRKLSAQSLAMSLLFGVSTAFVPHFAFAQSLDDNEGAVEVPSSGAGSYTEMPEKGAKPANGVVGRKAAQKYMGAHPAGPAPGEPESRKRDSTTTTTSLRGTDSHYLSVEFGSFISDNAYKWGNPDSQSNVGRWRAGVTYRIGEWLNSMDLAGKIMYDNYSLNDGYAKELSFMPVIMFPDATSHFPLYFGGGLGPGIFLQPIPTRPTVVTIDYTLFAGVRFFDIYKSTGAFIEAGLKNHFLLLSDGQFNGYFVSIGAIFTF